MTGTSWSSCKLRHATSAGPSNWSSARRNAMSVTFSLNWTSHPITPRNPTLPFLLRALHDSLKGKPSQALPVHFRFVRLALQGVNKSKRFCASSQCVQALCLLFQLVTSWLGDAAYFRQQAISGGALAAVRATSPLSLPSILVHLFALVLFARRAQYNVTALKPSWSWAFVSTTS